MVQIQPTRDHAPVLEIPPTGVGGWFRSNLHATTHRFLKSHPREWVDGSDPTYTRPRTAFFNPTHGSGWMVQIQPTRDHAPRSSIPPTGVGGWFRSNLHATTHRVLQSHP